jgi:hypothetical protein
MPPTLTRTHRAAAAALLILLGGLALSACGGSSKSTTPSSASASQFATGAQAGRGRFRAFRECMQKNGITLPTPTPGQRPGPGQRPPGAAGGFFLGGPPGSGAGPRLPSGVTRAQYEAAVKKCGGPRAFRGAAGGLRNPAFQQALLAFARCMRQNGVNVPAPNTSRGGPIFNTAGIDTASAQFKAARAKCTPLLRRGLPAGAAPGRPGG